MSDPHTAATSSGVDQGDIDRRTALAEHLGKGVWPADRDTLVAKAAQHGAPGDVIGQHRSLPSGQQPENGQNVARARALGIEPQRVQAEGLPAGTALERGGPAHGPGSAPAKAVTTACGWMTCCRGSSSHCSRAAAGTGRERR